MALMICPDCGKRVSSRADKCPDCGCPSEFFKNIEESKDNNDSVAVCKPEEPAVTEHKEQLTEQQSVQKIQVKEAEKPLAVFNILGTTISYPARTEKYIDLIRRHQDDALRSLDYLEQIYDKAGDLDKAWHDVVAVARAQFGIVIEDDRSALYSLGYNIDEDFYTENGADIEEHIEEALSRYQNLLVAENNLKEQRAYERSGRSKWVGGGFGIKGAIKGAVKAGAMNAVTGLGRAVGDSVVNSGDKAAIAKRKKELYKDKKDIKNLSFALYQVITIADYLTAALYAGSDTSLGLSFDIFRANNDYQAAVSYETTSLSLAQRCVEILEEYPLIMGAYERILKAIPQEDHYTRNEVINMISFWNAGYYFKKVIDESNQTNTSQSEQNDMKYCSYCGKKINRTQKFCNYCGKECIN